MLVAGEASGDKHGAALVRALIGSHPETHFEIFGSGGEEMRAAGVDTLVDAADMAVIGVLEIAGAIGRLLGAYRRLVSAMRDRKPDAVILIDWPDFNLRLAKRAHGWGFKTVYYISPQIWAWKRYRVKTIRRYVDRMLVILPFEKEFYRRYGIEVDYVGHPLASTVSPSSTRKEFCARYGLDPERDIIALLPGSRRKEVHYHLPAMLDAAKRIESMISAAVEKPQFVAPLASTVDRAQVDAIVRDSRVRVTLVDRDTYNALGHASFAVVASGTATVEAALLGIPMIIVYRGSELNWRLLRPLIHLDTFGMVNLIAGRRIVPELMQHAVTGERIAAETQSILSDPARMKQMKNDLAEVKARLSEGGMQASERAAELIIQQLCGKA
jgi:lipid-A-disaccharide synthase